MLNTSTPEGSRMTLAVPTLDLQALGTDPRPLAEACTEWGFFKLTGHGVDPARRARFTG